MLVINKDHDNAHPVRIVFSDVDGKAERTFTGPVARITFGKNQYQWHQNRKQGYTDPDGPPAASTIQATRVAVYPLLPASVSVVRGKLGASSENR